MGVAFQNRSVHERTWIALVSVTYYILFFFLLISRKLPFYAGWETTAASAAKSRVLHSLNDVFWLHLCQNLRQRLVSAVSDVFVNVFRINPTAVSKSNTHLLREEIKLIF